MSTPPPELETWYAAPITMPPRSRLYRLVPLGVGTAGVESLASYLLRLAAAHCWRPQILINKEIGPLFRLAGSATQGTERQLTQSVYASVNGNNKTAAETVRVLRQLTATADLEKLTLLPWGHHVAARILTRPVQAWCPLCLHEWREQQVQLHLPLLWSLETVSLCPKHGTRLCTACPHCQATHPPLSPNQHLGNCPRCQNWLGRAPSPSPPVEPGVRVCEEFAASGSAELVEYFQQMAATEAPPLFPANIQYLIRRCFQDQPRTMGRFLRMPNSDSVKRWAGGGQRPTLRSVLQVAYCLNVKPQVILLGSLEKTLPNLSIAMLRPSPGPIRPAFRKHNHQKIKAALQAVIDADALPPPSLKSVCDSLGYHATYVGKVFPELTRQILESRREYVVIKREIREFFVKMLVNSAVMQLHYSGVYPSMNKVQAVLEDRVSLLDPLARKERLRLITELGPSSHRRRSRPAQSSPPLS